MEETYLPAFSLQHLENELDLKKHTSNRSADQQVPRFIVSSPSDTCETFFNKSSTVVCINRKVLNENAGRYKLFESNKFKGQKGKPKKKRKPRGNYPIPDSPSMLPSSPREIKLHCSKQREQTTPIQSSLKLMQKHRENERVRHQTLNELMKKLRSQIPGNEEYSKGTKVVTMQRAICYIVYLEKMITNVCKELDVKLDNSKKFLTSRLTHQDLRKTLWGHNSDRFENAAYQCGRFPRITQADPKSFTSKTPNKLCSTIRNSPDNCMLPLKEDSVSEVEHLPGLSLLDEDYFYDPFSHLKSKTPSSENSTAMQHSLESNNEVRISENHKPTNETVSELNDFVPICKQVYPSLLNGDPMLPQVIDCPRMMCTKNRRYEINLTETAEELQFVPPDSVTSVGSINFHSNIPALHEFNNNCQILPKKNIKVEEDEVPETSSLQRPLRGIVGKKGDDQFESYCWKFHEIANIRRQKVELTSVKEEHFDPIEEKTLERKFPEEKVKTPLKVDHRRASWMNGFMMYSQMNRRKFIDANPGVHTSHISKMMGHAWRSMPAEKQLPYKEKAQKYAQYMQTALLMSLPENNGSSTNKILDDKEEETISRAKNDLNVKGSEKLLEFTIKTE